MSRTRAVVAAATAGIVARAVALIAAGVVGLGAAVAAPASASSAASALPWFDGGRPGPRALSALALLADAGSHGLRPDDYAASALGEAFAQAAADAPVEVARASHLERALTDAMHRYLNDLHRGRAPPPHLPGPASAFDADATLRAAFALHDLTQAVRAAVPPLAQYERLREALARYRALHDDAAWRRPVPPLPLPPGGQLRALDPGFSWAGVPVLAQRLVALGDLDTHAVAAADDAAATVYGPALVAAVRAFQQRHGLVDDGVVGRATWAALQVRPAQRARQLELALERLRWTPLLQAPRMIVVNVPEFVLRAYEVQHERIVVRAEMKVIVGRALDQRTPLIGADLRLIEFNPYWNVPYKIARDELVPQLRRRPAGWAREGYEFVGTGAADPVLTDAKLQAVLDGSLRIRQRPGPRNALGDIKFVFPNHEAIYLHHTPAVGLFERARRDFSHGCIRVEQPVALAAFALAEQPAWTEARIRAAMAAGTPSGVALDRPVPVLVAYGTALVKQGRVHFFDDVYGHDRGLDAALRRLARPPIAVPAP